MNSIYKNFIKETFPQEPDSTHLKCVDFSRAMQSAFPELEFVWGYVDSEHCLDNIDYNGRVIKKQYPHAWLVDKDGTIIDPTATQFINMGQLEYHKLPSNSKITGTCMICGRLALNQNPTCHDDACIQEFVDEMDPDYLSYFCKID